MCRIFTPVYTTSSMLSFVLLYPAHIQSYIQHIFNHAKENYKQSVPYKLVEFYVNTAVLLNNSEQLCKIFCETKCISKKVKLFTWQLKISLINEESMKINFILILLKVCLCSFRICRVGKPFSQTSHQAPDSRLSLAITLNIRLIRFVQGWTFKKDDLGKNMKSMTIKCKFLYTQK